ncbi:hypothetical protein ACSFB8_00710 [Enterococcus faecalis]
MNVIVEMTDALGLDYYFVTLKATSNGLLLSSGKAYYRNLHEIIPYQKISHSKIIKKDQLIEISFECENKQYRFVDYGNGVADYLQKHLSFL